MKIALCLIVKGSDSEVDVLSRCLTYASYVVDKIFITVTHKPGKTPCQKVLDVCKAFDAQTSTFEWINDFSAARNFNFSQVPSEYDYILWLDADDVLRNGENLRATIESKPEVDAFSLWYLYAFDEYKNPIVVHHKTRVIKNNGALIWEGKLHEDFKENRSVLRFHIEGIDVLHLSNPERFTSAKERNYEISKAAVTSDPRTLWNLGNSALAAGKIEEALQAFQDFIKTSYSDEEKFLIHLRLADCYWHLNKRNEAIKEAQIALGMKPTYPDAYHLLGYYFYEQKKFREAKDHLILGLQQKVPYYSIVVYNPREYDYVPLKRLALTYVALNQPKQALQCLEACEKIHPDKNLEPLIAFLKKQEKTFDAALKAISKLKGKTPDKIAKGLERLPKEVRFHPLINQFRNTSIVRTETTGKDMAIFCGYTTEAWTPQTAILKGIGGSEEAVINLSKRFVKNGWNVTVYNNCGFEEQEFDGVKYKPFQFFNYRDKWDVLVLWRHPMPLDYDLNASKIFLDLHDVLPPGEFTTERVKKVDKIFVKSAFHRSLFPHVPDEKFAIIPNGIDSPLFTTFARCKHGHVLPSNDVVDDARLILGDTSTAFQYFQRKCGCIGKDIEIFERDPMLMINTSSPDRSLKGLVKLFKRVKEKVPQAKLKWAYGWNVFDSVHSDSQTVMEWKAELLKEMEEAGVENLDRLSHPDIAKLYLSAGIFAYPTEFAEIDCISLSKAMAAGAVPVTTDFAALGEKKHTGTFLHSPKTKDDWSKPYQFDFSMEGNEDEWVDAVVKLLQNPPSETDRIPMREWALEKFDWDRIAALWEKHLD